MDAPDAGAVTPTDYITAWRQVMQQPDAFFATMPETGGLGAPLGVLASCAALDAAGMLVVSQSFGMAVGTFVGLLIGTFVLAAALTLTSQHVVGGRAGFEPVFRVVAYGSAPAVFFWVPRVAVLACLYAFSLHVRGIERVQTLDPGRAALATVLAWVALWLVVRGLGGAPLGWIGTR